MTNPIEVRCKRDHFLARVEVDGTIIVRNRDGCEVRIPSTTIVVQQKVIQVVG